MNLRKKYVVACILVILGCEIDQAIGQVSGEKNVNGRVASHETMESVAYVNIGIINSHVGTISNQDGTFILRIPDSYRNDTLTFSALGYYRESFPVHLLDGSKPMMVLLDEKKTVLKEVTVSSTKETRKEFELGNRYYKGGLNLSSTEDANAGASVALRIENKYPGFHDELVYPVFLQEAKVRIADNTTGDFKIRVRLYDVDSLTGSPGNDLLNKSIVLESAIRKGWLSFDLATYNLQVDGSFFLAFEWIMEEHDRAALKEMYRQFEELHPDRVRIDTTVVEGRKLPARHYINFLPGTSFGVSLLPFSLEHYICYSRTNSLGEWKRAPFILTARVKVAGEPFDDKK